MIGKKTLLIVTNVDWFLISHRLVLAKAAVKDGWQVYVACEDTGRGKEISCNGIEFIPFSFSRSGTNPISELMLFNKFYNLYKRIQPTVIHQITIKPVVYGTLAARLARINGVVNAISGLGYMFMPGRIGFMQFIVLKLMKLGANRQNVEFIFQNNEDMEVLKSATVITELNRVNLIKGSGVDLNEFKHTPQNFGGKINILLPCRMLWDKGIKELREATEILKQNYKTKIKFTLVGSNDDQNKSSVPTSYLKDWEETDFVEWKGNQQDIRKYYENSNIVVLPSYREGLPKSLIEACAIGRPIITTDAVGCKDCVDEGVNGFKVPVGDSKYLAMAIEKLVNDNRLITNMGNASRIKAEKDFDVNNVVNKHLEIYNRLLD